MPVDDDVVPIDTVDFQRLMPIRTRQRTKNKIVKDEKWDVVTLGCRLCVVVAEEI